MPKDQIRRVLLVAVLSLVAALAIASPAASGTAKLLGDRYVVVLAGTQTEDGFAFAESRAAALTAVQAAGGTVVTDLSRQIGVLVVQFPFVLAHLGKPEIELFSTLFGGFVYAWVDWRTGSILWSAAAHIYIVTLLVVLSAA